MRVLLSTIQFELKFFQIIRIFRENQHKSIHIASQRTFKIRNWNRFQLKLLFDFSKLQTD